MKKKTYSSSDVEGLLQGVVEQDRCPMDEAMEGRILAHIRCVAGKYRRRRRYKRVAAVALPVLLLGVAIPLLSGTFATSPGAGSVAATGRPQPEHVAATGHTQPGDTDARPVEHRRVDLGNIDSTLELGYSPAPQQRYDAGGNQRCGASLQGACKYTACTDTL